MVFVIFAGKSFASCYSLTRSSGNVYIVMGAEDTDQCYISSNNPNASTIYSLTVEEDYIISSNTWGITIGFAHDNNGTITNTLTQNFTINNFYNYGTILGGSEPGIQIGCIGGNGDCGTGIGGSSTNQVDNFYNDGYISSTTGNYSLKLDHNSNITTLINEGYMGAITGSSYSDYRTSIEYLYNYGTIGVSRQGSVFGGHLDVGLNFWNSTINESAEDFNSFSGYSGAQYEDIEHITISSSGNTNVTLANSFVWLINVGNEFSFYDGEDESTKYSLAKLITNQSGNYTAGSTWTWATESEYSDLYRLGESLVSTNSAYTFEHDNENFWIYVKSEEELTEDTPGANASLASVAHVNNLINFARYGRMYMFGHYDRSVLGSKKKQKTKKGSTTYKQHRYDFGNVATIENGEVIYGEPAQEDKLLSDRLALGSSDSYVISDEGFLLQTESSEQNTLDAILDDDEFELVYNDDYSDDYHYFFTPFVNYSKIGKSVSMDGMSYGFVTGFNTRLGEDKANTLGVHLGFSYGNLDYATKSNNLLRSLDTDSMNLLLGLHYKLDLNYGVFIKAFGEFYYSMSDLKYGIDLGDGYGLNDKDSTNTFGGNISVYIGDELNFKEAGKLEIEAGISYMGLRTDEMRFENIEAANTYEATTMNLLYAELGANYYLLFSGGFGLNLAGGVRYLVDRPSATLKIYDTSYKYKIALDKLSYYGSAGISYFVTNDIELGLNYLGDFGDTHQSHSGFAHIRLWW